MPIFYSKIKYMKEFMKNNKVTYNLISFTGFKSMLLFECLLKGPKTYEEIKEYFANNPYLHETITIDTLRVYINSLERFGCEIVRGKKSEGSKYKLLKHPFELKLSDEETKSLIKVFKTICKSIELEDLLALTKFFKKIANYIENEKLKQNLLNISPLKNINQDILKTLILACRKNEEITILYNSPSSSTKNIDILTEKLALSNNKLYLYGKSPQYPNTASFLVSRIKDVPTIKLQRTITIQDEEFIIGCEIYDKNIPLLENEKIIAEDADKMTIEITSSNKFLTRQRILYLGSDCKVLYPQSFKDDIYSILKKMKEEYIAEKI